MKILFRICLLFFVVSSMPLQAEGKLGLVLMHGKTGHSEDGSPIGELANYLKDKGMIVIKAVILNLKPPLKYI